MASTLRVHTLAKELGVPSKAVIEKCRAEGIELKNHMAALSVGLAESIREWFSAGADVTSVEVAEKVDVEAARAARRKRRAKEGDEGTHDGDSGVAVAEAEPGDTAVAAPPAVAEPDAAVVDEAAAPIETVAADAEPAVVAPSKDAADEALAAPEAPAEAPPAVETDVEVPAAVAAEPDVVEGAEERPAAADAEAEDAAVAEAGVAEDEPAAPPESVAPAGPKLVPKPAELKGPNVVRIEAPDPVRTPRPRPRPPAARGPSPAQPTEAPSTLRRKGKGRGQEEADARARSRSPRRRGTSTDVDQRLREWRDQDLIERKERLASVTGHGLQQRRAAERRRQATAQTGVGQPVRKEHIAVSTPIAIKDLCATLGVPFTLISKKLMEHTGRLWTVNQSLDAEQVELIALDLGITIEVERAKTAYERIEDEFEQRERPNAEIRPPIVAMLGHVDHGKTSLLDAIRATRVAAGEAGGITQHIGAYRLDRGDWHVTFVDTPGHEAFTAMRARGADMTDVVVLVVAADDGVMPQTVEAINHAKAAEVAIVVALNKIDIPGVDVDRVYGQLAEHGLVPSAWGGETDVIPTSATTGQGIDDLVSHLSTLSELMELTADPDVPAMGSVIEAQMREGRGVTAQVLVREGTLKVGQTIVCGSGAGRIRALRDDRGKQLKSAGPSTPVEVTGLDELPVAGDALYVVDNLNTAKGIAQEVRDQRRAESLVSTSTKVSSLESLMLDSASAEVPTLRVIVKADTQGSVEVLRKSLDDFPNDKAKLTVLHAAVGAITEADVNLAKASEALIIGFHVVADDRARQLADQVGVEVRLYRVIYEILDDLQKALVGLLEPEQKEEIRGAAEVRQIFHVSKVGTIAGCYVTDGTIHRNHLARLIRDGRVVAEGKGLDSLKRFKDDAREVRAGLECGIKLQDFDDVKPGDVIQSYELIEVAQQL